MEDQNKVHNCLHCLSINSNLRSLKYDECVYLSTAKTNNNFKKGQIIFNESNHPTGLYCIQKGMVKIYKLRSDGKDQIVRFAGDGDFIGYRSVLCREPYKASAIALSDTSACYIPTKVFFELIESNPKFALQLIQNLASNLKEAETRLVNITSMHAKARIVQAILIMFEKFGVNQNNELNVQLTRKEIGELANTSTETTIREISDLNKEEIIKIKGKKVILKNMDKLRSIPLY